MYYLQYGVVNWLMRSNGKLIYLNFVDTLDK